MLCGFKLWLGAATVLLVSGAAWAGTGSEDNSLELGSVLSQGALDERRARDGRISMQLQDTDGKVENNVARQVETGSNFITEGAFNHNHGFPMSVQNTGNNVLIQNAVILNLEVK